jgi:hypothetical protein
MFSPRRDITSKGKLLGAGGAYTALYAAQFAGQAT